MKNFNLAFILSFLTIPVLVNCTGKQSYLFSTTPAGQLESMKPSTYQSTFANFDVNNASLSTASSLGDSMARANNFTATSGSVYPSKVAVGSLSALSFSTAANSGMTSYGVLPDHLFSSFSFIFSINISAAGDIFNYGSDDLTQSLKLSLSGTDLLLRHQVTDGNYRIRKYNFAGYLNQNIILAIVAGVTGKDLEVYVNGFRLSDYVSISAGSSQDFDPVQRQLFFGGPTSASFKLFNLACINGKAGPKTIFQISKFQGSILGVSISSAITPDIRRDIFPTVEPEALNFNYINSLVLTPKCIGCHRSGGTSPFLDSYAAVMSAVNASGARVVIPGNSSNSRFYLSVLGDEMPYSGTPLSASEKTAIQSWIDAGANE